MAYEYMDNLYAIRRIVSIWFFLNTILLLRKLFFGSFVKNGIFIFENKSLTFRMDTTDQFEKARSIWLRVVKSSENIPENLDVEIHRRLLNMFHVGPYYYYIFNCFTADFDYLDDRIQEILGYPKHAVSPPFIYTKVHPEDWPYVIDFEDKITSFYEGLPADQLLDYKTSYDYRILTNDNKYLRILQQVTVIQAGEDRSIYRTFGVHTDISHLKKQGSPTLNAMRLDGQPIFSYSDKNVFLEPKPVLLTKRELEIVRLIADGASNVLIADSLNISPHTVKTHRKNIKSKTKSTSSAELIKISIENGWL